MSANRKGGNPIVALLLAHGEKLGIAIAAAVAGWLLYGSLSQSGIDKTPQQLTQLVSDARSHMRDFSWDDATEDPERSKLATEFRPLAAIEVDPSKYAGDKRGWSSTVVERTALRADPELLTAVSLQGFGGTDLMGFEGDADFRDSVRLDEIRAEREKQREAEEERKRQEREQERGGRPTSVVDTDPNRRPLPGGRRNQGVSLDDDDIRKVVSYAIVVAKVPVEDQIKAYEKTFAGAAGAKASQAGDLPVYVGYYVERREVIAGGKSEWEPVRLRNGYNNDALEYVDPITLAKCTADWVEDPEDPVDGDYLHDTLTFPLPPRLGRSWGAEVVHPDIPLQVETDMAVEDEPEELSIEGGDGGFIGGIGADPSGRGPRPRRGFSGGPNFDESFAPPGGGFGGGRRSRGSGTQYNAPFLLLRFCDLMVTPGKQYQYRVKLAMRDPNAGVSRRFLDKAVLARRAALTPQQQKAGIRETEWSEPSTPISIPQAGGVLVSQITPPPKSAANAEPAVTFLVGAFDRQDSKIVESATDRKLYRGGVANFVGKDVEYIDERELVKVERFAFRTDVTLLDLFGGQKLSRDDTTPAEVLLMDASGRLIVRHELIDRQELLDTRATYSEEEGAGGRRGGASPVFDAPSFDIGF